MSRSWQPKRVPGPKGSDSDVPPKANLLRWDFRQLLLCLPALEARAKYLLLPHCLLFSFLDRLILKPNATPMNSVEHPVRGSYYIRFSCTTQRVFSGWQQRRAASKMFPRADVLIPACRPIGTPPDTCIEPQQQRKNEKKYGWLHQKPQVAGPRMQRNCPTQGSQVRVATSSPSHG